MLITHVDESAGEALRMQPAFAVEGKSVEELESMLAEQHSLLEHPG